MRQSRSSKPLLQERNGQALRVNSPSFCKTVENKTKS